MRFVLPLLALLVPVFATSSLIARQNLPSCASTCIATANFGNCAPVDDSCLCHSAQFINSTTSCIQSSCTGSDLQNAESYAQQLCIAVGVTLTAPSANSATPSSSVASSTASSSSSPTASSSSGAPLTSSISVFAAAVVAVAIAAIS